MAGHSIIDQLFYYQINFLRVINTVINQGKTIHYTLKDCWIIAGNLEEFEEFLARANTNSKGPYFLNYRYLDPNDINDFVRTKNMHGYFVGSWKQRPDIEVIQAIIKHRRNQEKELGELHEKLP